MKRILLGTILLVFVTTIFADTKPEINRSVKVTDLRLEMIPNSSPLAAKVFLTLDNQSDKPQTLISASSPYAKKMLILKNDKPIHVSIKSNGKAVLQANKTSDDIYYISMTEMTRNFPKGSTVYIVLNFADNTYLPINAPV